jgi:thiol-disulfide isomerase/thioredoxin
MSHSYLSVPVCPCMSLKYLLLAFGSGFLLIGADAHAQFDKTPWLRSQSMPKIDVVDLQGQRWTSAKLKGRVVVLNFWATWCGPCKEEVPSLQALHSADGPGPLVIGINVKEAASTVQRFVKAQRLDFPVVLDPQGDLVRQWGVRIYPTTVLIGADGQARWRVVGEVDWSGAQAAGWLGALQGPSGAGR